MDWPLIERELSRRARSDSLYMLRFAVGGVAFFYLAGIYEFSTRYIVNPERIGLALTRIGQTFQLVAAYLLPLLLSAGLVAREKQERTLGLLLLADTSGFGVYGAKFLSAFLPCALLVIGVLPVLATAALLGGIEVGELALQMAHYLATAFAVTVIGMLASIFSSKPGPAFFLAAAAVLVIGLVTWWIQVGSTVTILFGFPMSFSSFLQSGPPGTSTPGSASNWILDLGAVGLGVVLMGVGWRCLPLMAHDRTPGRSFSEMIRRSRRVRKARRIPQNPSQKILTHNLGGWSSSIRPWPLKAAVSIGLAGLAVLNCAGSLFLVALIARDVLSAFKTGYESGVIDDVRLTADSSKTLGRWIYRSQASRCLFYLPALVFAGGLGFMGRIIGMSFPVFDVDFAPFPILVITLMAAGFVLFALWQLRLIVALTCRAYLRSPENVWGSVISVVTSYVLILALAVLLILGATGAMDESGSRRLILVPVLVSVFLLFIPRLFAEHFAEKFEERDRR